MVNKGIARHVRPPPAALVEQRAQSRRPARLRSAKIVSAAGRFVAECRVGDVSLLGLRVALLRGETAPPAFWLHIDDTGEMVWASVAWRRGATLGLRLCAAQTAPPGAPDRHALRTRYYGIGV